MEANKSAIEAGMAFENHKDQEQCISLWNDIKQSQLITNLSVPEIISQQIAEYSTGIVKACKIKKCKNKIVQLEQDFDENKQKYVHETYLTHDQAIFGVPQRYYTVYFCNQCKHRVMCCNGCDMLHHSGCPWNCEDEW
eukprot:250913_1